MSLATGMRGKPCKLSPLLGIWALFYVTCILCKDVKPQTEKYVPDYQFYHNLSRIGQELAKLAHKHSNIFHLRTDYKSRQGRTQLLLRMTNFSNEISDSDDFRTKRIKILFSYGEHAREFLPIETLLHFLRKVTDGLLSLSSKSEGEFSRQVLQYCDIYVIIMANPDGRNFVEMTKNFCWRGTSSGVDLNRNFDWEFGNKGSSGDPKDEEYRGVHVFSEPECHIYRQLTSEHKFDVFISFHSGIRQIYIPFADTKSKKTHREPENLKEMMRLASILSHSTKHGYQFGKAVDLNDYTADGTIFDYMAGVRRIPISYAIELWGPTNHQEPSCFDLFNPPSEQLKETVEEIYPLYEELLRYLIKRVQNFNRSEATVFSNHSGIKQGRLGYIHSGLLPFTLTADQSGMDVPSLTFGYVMLLFVVLMTLVVAVHGKYPFCRRLYQRRRVVNLRALSSTFAVGFINT